MTQKKIYVGCSLTHAPQEYVEQIDLLKDKLREQFEVLDFVGVINGTPKDVFEHDTWCVKTCDLLIADCTYPAIGLGYEIGVAMEMEKPILFIAQESAHVSRLILGIDRQNTQFVRYSNILEVLPQVFTLV